MAVIAGHDEQGRLQCVGKPVVALPREAERGRMDYRILGPLEVRVGDHAVELGGDKQRALLAILLVHVNESVSADRLIDGLWGEQLPPTALKTLQGYISRLRKALDNGDHESPGSANGVLVTRGRGYLLRVEPGELDLDRFRDLVEEGRRSLALGDAEDAARILRAALALWRGPPLADFAYEPFAQPTIAQAEELHLATLEERIEADLARIHRGGRRVLSGLERRMTS
ncbi:MAG: AfsR/SARP family transcriptional regulator [Solirubrobacteraceae bacterium]